MGEKPRNGVGDCRYGTPLARWFVYLVSTAILGLSLASAAPAHAQYCPEGQAPTNEPPTQNVVVSILSVKPNSDMEGADDYIPFYDNRADIYGTVTIDGEDFALPKINDDNFPHWGEQNGRFVRHVAGGIIPIRVQVRESDSASSDDSVDVTPAANRDTLELDFDTCALRITGDVSGSAQNVIQAKAGNDSDDATIRLRVEMEDGRAITSNDVALVNFDLIQVVPQVSRIVADKPIVGIVRVANNTPITLPVSVRLRVTGQNDVPVLDVTESLGEPLQPGEVRKKYLLESAPLKMQDIGRPYTMKAEARILHNYDETSPDPNDPSPRCRILTTQVARLLGPSFRCSGRIYFGYASPHYSTQQTSSQWSAWKRCAISPCLSSTVFTRSQAQRSTRPLFRWCYRRQLLRISYTRSCRSPAFRLTACCHSRWCSTLTA